MQNRMVGNAYHTTVICIDSYQDMVFSGRFYNPFLKKERNFQSLMQLLLQMEDLLDKMGFPQPFSTKRAFAPIERPAISGQESQAYRGKLATFSVQILFRQKASWQGRVTWMETDREESFRSVLELLFLMHSAIGD